MKKYRTILADPPWGEIGGGATYVRGAQRHYPLMKTDAICNLQVDDAHVKWQAQDNAHLYLWVTNSFLEDGLKVMAAWNFEYRTMITWAKDRFGLGQYFRGQTEHVLFGVRGNIPYRTKPDGKRAQGTTLITAPRGKHSQKPEELRAMIEIVSPGPYLELFARREDAPGWDFWGNEVACTNETAKVYSDTKPVVEPEVSSEINSQTEQYERCEFDEPVPLKEVS